MLQIDDNNNELQKHIKKNDYSQRKACKKAKNGSFSKHEDELLLLLVYKLGKRFRIISRKFPKRGEHELKNRYYSSLRDKEQELFDPKSQFYFYQKPGHTSKIKKEELQNSLNQIGLEKEIHNATTTFLHTLNNFFLKLDFSNSSQQTDDQYQDLQFLYSPRPKDLTTQKQ